MLIINLKSVFTLIFITAQLILITAGHAQQKRIFHQFNEKQGIARTPILTIGQDSKGFLWLGGGYQFYKYDGVKFHPLSHLLASPNPFYINAIAVDAADNVIIGTSTGLFVFDQVTGRRYHYTDKTKLIGNVISAIQLLRDKKIAVGTDKGLNILTIAKGDTTFTSHLYGEEIKAIHADGNSTTVSSNKGYYTINPQINFHINPNIHQKIYQQFNDYVTTIFKDNNHIWLGTFNSGIVRYTPATHTFIQWNQQNSKLASNRIRKIIKTSAKEIMIGTLKGLSVIDSTSTIATYKHEVGHNQSLSQNSIYDILIDQQQNIWLGTYFGGINVIYNSNSPFLIYRPTESYNSISSNIVSGIAEDSQGYWIGTEEEGLNFIRKDNQTIEHYNRQLSSNLIKDVFTHDNMVYIGTYNGGFNKLNKKTGQVEHYLIDQNNILNPVNNVYSILKDSEKNLWIGTNSGLFLFDEQNKKISKIYKETQGLLISKITEIGPKEFLIATSSGLFHKIKERIYLIEQTRDITFNSIFLEQGNTVWCGTTVGKIAKYDIKSRKLTYYPIKSAINLLSVLKSGDNIWVSTPNGIVSYNPSTNSEHLLTTVDGLPSNEFNKNSYLSATNNELLFGTLNGLIKFDPNEIKYNLEKQKVYFTKLRLFNKNVEIGDSTHILNKDISLLTNIELAHSQNVISIDFALLNYIKSEKNKYAYQLAGLDPDWVFTDTPTATYMNLVPGDYILNVKGANNDGIWSNTTTLKLTILPPLWKTWWAYLIYVTVIIGIIYLLNRFLIERALLLKSEKDHQAKINFFSYISHEIRTPLTLITHPLKQLLKETKASELVQDKLMAMEKNTNRLLSLINELLDFRKIEENSLHINVYNYNLSEFLTEISHVFLDLAREKEIEYNIDVPNIQNNVFFDRIQFEKVIYNLISNAIKYSHNGGSISISLTESDTDINIYVRNTGIAIPMDNLDKIFEQYYRTPDSQLSHDGTGIGLALSKILVNLHGGTISAYHEKDTPYNSSSTTFRIKLLKGITHLQDKKHINILTKDKIYSISRFESHNRNPLQEQTNLSLLIVEDNPDLNNMLVDMLSGLYKVSVAYNGLNGIQKAQEEIPDLILSDVMMPGISGLELCQRLKTETKTSHIPIVLLTALGTPEKQIEGLEHGADVYLVKPFDRDYLLLTIRNLLALSERNRKSFNLEKFIEKRSTINKDDDEFLTKAIHIINLHLADEELSVDFLCKELGMSHPILNRKIKAMTNLSIINFIKSIRMNQASKMLKTGLYTIVEVAYEVGFSDRKYFSKEFKKQFGVNPTDYIRDTNDPEN